MRIKINNLFKWLFLMFFVISTPRAYAFDLDELLRAANKGDVSASYDLGVMYENGEGVEQDYAKAIEWYRQAANREDASAQANLGVMYAYGRGVEQSHQKALMWSRKACDNNNDLGCKNYTILNAR